MTTLADDLVSDELWALVAPLLPAPPRPAYGGRRRTISDRAKVDRQFLAYALSFRRRRRPALLAQLARWSQGHTVVILRSRRAVRQFIDQLPPPG